MADDKANTCYDVKLMIKPFKGKNNFMLWQRKMKNVLILQDLDDTILGIEKKPTDMTDEDWKKMDKKAKSSIELHLADNVMLNVGEDMNAKETWEKLEKIYKRKTLSEKIELYLLQMEEGGDLQVHLSKFQNCVIDLSMMGEKYKDDDKALLLLRSLPPSFKHFKTKIMFGKSTLKFDEVIEALQSHLKVDEKPETLKAHKQTRGFYAKGKERGRSHKRSDKSDRPKSKGTDEKCCFE